MQACKGLHLVPWVGIEPTLPKELDFESSASTNSATKAFSQLDCKCKKKIEFQIHLFKNIRDSVKLFFIFATSNN
jgi:hypothetical protein